MNKRDKVLSLLDPSSSPSYIPAAFFLHFPKDCHRGQAAIDKHLEYYRYTGMDFVKIQYEFAFPRLDVIQSPDDWARMPAYRAEFFQDQLDNPGGCSGPAGMSQGQYFSPRVIQGNRQAIAYTDAEPESGIPRNKSIAFEIPIRRLLYIALIEIHDLCRVFLPQTRESCRRNAQSAKHLSPVGADVVITVIRAKG